VLLQGAGVVGLQVGNDLIFAVRAKHCRAINFLDFTHLIRQHGTAVEQVDQFQVHGVDLLTQFREGFGHGE